MHVYVHKVVMVMHVLPTLMQVCVCVCMYMWCVYVGEGVVLMMCMREGYGQCVGVMVMCVHS